MFIIKNTIFERCVFVSAGAAVQIRRQAQRALVARRSARRVRLRRRGRLLTRRQAGEHAHPVVSAAHRQPTQQLGGTLR